MTGLPLPRSVGIVMLAAVLLGRTLPALQEPTAAPQSPTASAPAQVPTAPLDGHTLFQQKGCIHCHGANAAGTDRGPSLQSVGRTWNREKMEQQVRDGGAAMPAFGTVLSDAEMQALLDFLAAKKAPLKHPRRQGSE
jgi:mono/diheme cytochrome c family protein